ncbi:pectate lyase [Trifolium repens]|nr:pectate lyase [Trifolium repens]
MAQISTKVLFILLVTFAIIIPCLEAGIGEFDDFLKAEAEEAHKIALQSYIPLPLGHDNHFHVHGHLSMEEATRRELKQKYAGKQKVPCEAPIDNCWRCKANWAKNLYKLAKCGKSIGN